MSTDSYVTLQRPLETSVDELRAPDEPPRQPKPVKTKGMTVEKKRRRQLVVLWILVGVLTVLGAIGGYVGSQITPPQYTSKAQLLWDPSALRYSDQTAYVPDAVSLDLQLEGQVLQITSDAVINPSAETLGLTPFELRAALTATVGTGNTALNITATADDPAEAQTIATTVVGTYRELAAGTLAEQYTAQADALQASIDGLNKDLDKAEPESPLETSLSSQIATIVSQQNALVAKAAAAPSPLSQLREASLPLAPSSLSPVTLVAVGGGLGFLIGIAILVLVRLRKPRTVAS